MSDYRQAQEQQDDLLDAPRQEAIRTYIADTVALVTEGSNSTSPGAIQVTTLSKQELIEFRKKLVRAKEMSCTGFIGSWYLCHHFGLPTLSPKDEAWYIGAPDEHRMLVWDRSIAHVDKLIREAK